MNQIEETVEVDSYELYIYRGTTKCFSVEWEAADGELKDLTEWTPFMQIKDRRGRVIIDLKKNSGIEVNEHDEIIITITPAQTKLLDENMSYEYDIMLYKNDDEIEAILCGDVIVINNKTEVPCNE